MSAVPIKASPPNFMVRNGRIGTMMPKPSKSIKIANKITGIGWGLPLVVVLGVRTFAHTFRMDTAILMVGISSNIGIKIL